MFRFIATLVVPAVLLGAKAAFGQVARPATQPLAENYPVHPDSQRKEGVPQGKLTQMPKWTESKVFPNTERDWWVYVPAQYDGTTPACVMVFQDGSGFIGEKGEFRAPIVFDNLINKKEMPVTIGIFITPGNDVKKNPPPKLGEKARARRGRSNRSFE